MARLIFFIAVLAFVYLYFRKRKSYGKEDFFKAVEKLELYLLEGSYRDASILSLSLVNSANEMFSESSTETSKVRYLYAKSLIGLGQKKAAKNVLFESIKIFNNKGFSASEIEKTILLCIDVLQSLGDFKICLQLLDKWRGLIDDSKDNIQSKAFLNQKYGEVYDAIADQENAESYYLKSLGYWKRCAGKSHPEYAYTIKNLGDLYFRSENYEQASTLLIQALEFYEGAKEVDNLSIIAILEKLQLSLEGARDFDKIKWVIQKLNQIKKISN